LRRAGRSRLALVPNTPRPGGHPFDNAHARWSCQELGSSGRKNAFYREGKKHDRGDFCPDSSTVTPKPGCRQAAPLHFGLLAGASLADACLPVSGCFFADCLYLRARGSPRDASRRAV